MSLDCPDLSLKYPTPADYQRLLGLVGVKDEDVLLAVRVGSRVYGTAQPDSDEDFMVVLSGDVKDDLLIRDKVNVTLRTKAGFQSSLDKQNVFALECYMVDFNNIFKRTPPAFNWKGDWGKLRLEALEKSQSDYAKAVRGPLMDYKAKKRLWHSLRVPMFAKQVYQDGWIRDFTEANELYWEIMTDPSDAAEYYANVWGAQRLTLIDSMAPSKGV